MLEKNADLQQLEKNITTLQQEKYLKSKDFVGFDAKSTHYYSSANNALNDIKDSLLKQKMVAFILQHEEKYKSHTAHFQDIIKNIEANESAMNDYHTILKVVLTLRLIEKYQKNSMPNDKEANEYLQKQENQIKQFEKMTEIDKK